MENYSNNVLIDDWVDCKQSNWNITCQLAYYWGRIWLFWHLLFFCFLRFDLTFTNMPLDICGQWLFSGCLVVDESHRLLKVKTFAHIQLVDSLLFYQESTRYIISLDSSTEVLSWQVTERSSNFWSALSCIYELLNHSGVLTTLSTINPVKKDKHVCLLSTVHDLLNPVFVNEIDHFILFLLFLLSVCSNLRCLFFDHSLLWVNDLRVLTHSHICSHKRRNQR